MDSQKRSAVVTRLARQLRNSGSWCGETHLQKSVFLLQELAGVDTGYDFILYKHGPFSFDLRDELTSMRGDGLLELVPQSPPYGPKLKPTAQSKEHEASFPKTLSRYADRIKFVTDTVADRGVAELERLATALWVTRQESQDCSIKERAEELHNIKPHVSLEQAKEALQEIDELLAAVPS